MSWRSATALLLSAAMLGGCIEHRYNVETEVRFEGDGGALRRTVVTRCETHDIPDRFESSVIGLMDWIEEYGEPLWFPLSGGRMGILGLQPRCWAPGHKPRRGAEVDLGLPHKATIYVFNDARSPTELDVYEAGALVGEGRAFSAINVTKRAVGGRLTSDIEAHFPAVAQFGRRDREGRGGRTRFGGVRAQRLTGDPSRREDEEVILVRESPKAPFTLQSEAESGLLRRLYRIGGMGETHEAPVSWRPAVCIEDECVELGMGSTRLETPSGAIYELRTQVLDLTTGDFVLGRGKDARFSNRHSQIRGS